MDYWTGGLHSPSQNNKTASETARVLNHPALVFGPIKKDVDGRVVAAEVKHNGFVINVSNIYAPVSCQSISVREDFFQIQYNYFHPNIVNILGDDFNTIDDPIVDVHLSNPKKTQITELTDLMYVVYVTYKIGLEPFTVTSKVLRGEVHKGHQDWIVYTSIRILKSFRR